MKEDEEKTGRPEGGMPKDPDENSQKGPQEESAESGNAEAAAAADGKRAGKKKEKAGGAQRVGETLRNGAKAEVDGAKGAARRGVDAAKQEAAAAKRAFSRDGIKQEIRNDIEQAKAEVQQVKEDLGIGRKKAKAEAAGDEGAPADGQAEPASDGRAAAEAGTAPETGGAPQDDTGEAAPADGQNGNAVSEGQEPSDAAAGAPQDAADTATDGGGVAPQQPARAAYTASVPQTSASAPAPADPTGSVNENYEGVAGDRTANVVGAETTGSQTESQTSEQSVTGSQENKTLTDTAQAQYDTYEAGKQAAAAQLAKAQEQYGLEPQADMENRLYEKRLAEIKAQNPDMDGKAAERKAHRMAKREAAREFETRKDDIYRRLAPDYKSDRAYQREQNIKAIIAGLGDFGRMAAQAVTAKHGGTILPFASLTKGAINDRRISDRERKALVAAYEQMRQGKLQEAQAQMQNYEKMQLDLIKSPAAYNTGKKSETSKAGSTSKSERQEKVDKWFKPVNGGRGSANDGGYVARKGRVLLPGVYNTNQQVDEASEVPMPLALAAADTLITAVSKAGLPNTPDWTDIQTIIKEVTGKGVEGSDSKAALQLVQGVDDVLKFLRPLAEAGDETARSILAQYKSDVERYRESYKDYNTGRVYGRDDNGGGSPQGGMMAQGPASVDDVFGTGGGSAASGVDIDDF